MKNEPKSAIETATELAGGAGHLADACGVSFQAVYKWIKKGYPPIDRCEAIESAVGGKVSKFDLLPPSFCEKPAAPPDPDPGHGGRQPASPHNILDTIPERSVVIESIPTTERKA